MGEAERARVMALLPARMKTCAAPSTT
jgi:hypothetical protein